MRSQGKIERKKKSVQLRNLDAKLVYLFDPTISKLSGNVSLTTCELSEKQKGTNNNEQKQNCTIERLQGKDLAPIQKFYNREMWPVDKTDQSMDNYSLIYPYKDDHWFRHQIHTVMDWILINGFSLYKSQVQNHKDHTEFLSEIAFDWIGRKVEDFGLFGLVSPKKYTKRNCQFCSKPAKRTQMQCFHCKKFVCSDHATDVRICSNCL